MSAVLQSQIWLSRLLKTAENPDGVQSNKAWAVDLGCNASTITRWGSGDACMSLDDWVRVAAICADAGRLDVVEGIEGQIVAALRQARSTGTTPAAHASPVAVALAAARAAGDTTRAIEQAIVDGDLDIDDAPSLDEAAERHEAIAHDLRGHAARARAGVVTLSVGGAR